MHKITPDTITVTPGGWRQEDGPDPSKHIMTLTVTGAAPGRWEISDGGWHDYFFHLRHNGQHINMTHWNQWDAVRVHIAHESGPYSVTVHGELPSMTRHGNTLSAARLAVHRAERAGYSATVKDADGNEIRFPRTPKRED